MATNVKVQDYIMFRTREGSRGLTHQHWLWKHQFGWLINPEITSHWQQEEAQLQAQGKSRVARQIADVGCGNGIWIAEEALSSTADSLVSFTGFDIADSNFPAKSNTLPNVNFELWNIHEPPPTQFHGQFDLVNLRLMIPAIPSGDPSGPLRNLLLLLKPGGWVQWGETTMDPDDLQVPQDSPWPKLWPTLYEVVNPQYNFMWPTRLGDFYKEAGLTKIQKVAAGEPVPTMRKYWTDNDSGRFEELIISICARMPNDPGAARLRETWKECEETMIDTQTMPWYEKFFWIGQKPM